jgi:hypothetical protein
MHQPISLDINCAIRRITHKKVWYLHSYDIEYDIAKWTAKYHKAHQFMNEVEATDFMRIFLGEERAQECDTFSEHETWTI